MGKIGVATQRPDKAWQSAIEGWIGPGKVAEPWPVSSTRGARGIVYTGPRLRLRVILGRHTMFLHMPEEALEWLDTHMAKDNSSAQLGQVLLQDRRRERRKRNRSCPRTRPTPAQKELDRQAALEAAASLQRVASDEEISGDESDRRSHSLDS
ncbi:hypothetical protein NDU88_003881 [Pleurodeles waltl]|uniref:Uncharacterized protein n=1 Tax=Pleurodeles waltl TaxID=8319 RepID=A0AAV7VFI1_PLEWA|nr:hypothetical protein NDU88_003881 [Pleurodeles waltl]